MVRMSSCRRREPPNWRQHGPQPIAGAACGQPLHDGLTECSTAEGRIHSLFALKDCSLEFGMSRNGCRFNVPTEDWLAFVDGMFQSTEILIQCPAALPSAAEVLSVSEGKKNARNSGGLGLRV